MSQSQAPVSTVANQPVLIAGTPPVQTRSRTVIHRMRRHPSALVGGVVLFVTVALTLLAPVIAPANPLATAPRESRQPPSANHILGTDALGRDIFSRILYGGRVSLVLGLISVAIGGVIGVILGLLAGYFRGPVDMLIMQITDVLLTLPGFLLALAVVAVLGAGIFNVMIAVGISLIPSFVRVVRGSVLAVRDMEYVWAAHVVGVGHVRLMVKHVLPNVIAPIIVLATVGVAGAILTAASLSFVGVGAQPPTPEWGFMVNEGRQYLRLAWWISTFPGMAIMIVVIAVNLIGDALRDALDPRLRQ